MSGSCRIRFHYADSSVDDVLYNIKINTDASMKYLRQKYNEYNNWAAALGYYHTGHKCIDSYAREILK